ncbi:hypothetical protein LCGC14_1889970, partial [marine sediment metagenome]
MAQVDPETLDKVRALSAYDFARLFILMFGDADTVGFRLLGKKSDNTFEVINSDDSGRLEVWDPKVGSLISYSGTTTADGAALGASLIDGLLAAEADFDGNLVIITSGAYEGQGRVIRGLTTGGTVTPISNFGGQILQDVTFTIFAVRTIPAVFTPTVGAPAGNWNSGVATGGLAGAVRGFAVMGGVLFAVAGNTVYSINSSGTATNLGTINTSIGNVG